MFFQAFVLLFGLALDHGGAQHQVGRYQGLLGVVEGEHVGGVVLLAVLAVELLAFFGPYDAYGDLGIGGQRVANPAGDLVAWQHGAVGGGSVERAELQRQGELV
ncbi:hypothetical protein D3C71_888760 [compost metagenome]